MAIICVRKGVMQQTVSVRNSRSEEAKRHTSSPCHGRSPEAISRTTQPKDQMSTLAL